MWITAPIDYAYLTDSELVGVRLVSSLASLGVLRYRDSWEGAVETLVADHFDPESDSYEPGPVGALFETGVVLDGLRSRRDALGLEGRTCRYIQVPLTDRYQTSINWVRGTVETTLEPVDLTASYVDHHAFGMTHERRNPTVTAHLASVTKSILEAQFSPASQWDQITATACPRCPYTVCCPEFVAQEVRFDG